MSERIQRRNERDIGVIEKGLVSTELDMQTNVQNNLRSNFFFIDFVVFGQIYF